MNSNCQHVSYLAYQLESVSRVANPVRLFGLKCYIFVVISLSTENKYIFLGKCVNQYYRLVFLSMEEAICTLVVALVLAIVILQIIVTNKDFFATNINILLISIILLENFRDYAIICHL